MRCAIASYSTGRQQTGVPNHVPVTRCHSGHCTHQAEGGLQAMLTGPVTGSGMTDSIVRHARQWLFCLAAGPQSPGDMDRPAGQGKRIELRRVTQRKGIIKVITMAFVNRRLSGMIRELMACRVTVGRMLFPGRPMVGLTKTVCALLGQQYRIRFPRHRIGCAIGQQADAPAIPSRGSGGSG